MDAGGSLKVVKVVPLQLNNGVKVKIDKLANYCYSQVMSKKILITIILVCLVLLVAGVVLVEYWQGSGEEPEDLEKGWKTYESSNLYDLDERVKKYHPEMPNGYFTLKLPKTWEIIQRPSGRFSDEYIEQDNTFFSEVKFKKLHPNFPIDPSDEVSPDYSAYIMFRIILTDLSPKEFYDSKKLGHYSTMDKVQETIFNKKRQLKSILLRNFQEQYYFL